VIVVDASALVAIGDQEPDARTYLEALERADSAVISSVNAIETGLLLFGRRRLRDVDDLNRWLGELDIEVDHSVIDHAEVLEIYLLFGRGYHRARLNFGDCFAYALARRHDAPLLYKGDDFALTDIRSALQPT
jgi:ribonuclease VapC